MSGFQTALRYTGLPASWFTNPRPRPHRRLRLRLPSRNWLLFFGTTGTLLSLYAYDRKRAADLRAAYIARVRHLAEEPLAPLRLPRKVTVYACKWPDDEDWRRGVRYFKKYIKPILNAAAIDYDIQVGTRHGALTRLIADHIHQQRRTAAGLEPPSSQRNDANALAPPLPVQLTEDERSRREREGGSIIIGRAALKEYMEGLRRGWLEPPVSADREEELARALADDGHFDELEEGEWGGSGPASESAMLEGEPIPTTSRIPSVSRETAQAFSPLRAPGAPASSSSPPRDKDEDDTAAARARAIPPPETIPPQPPLLLVPFTNHIGFRQIPHMIYDFFTQRYKVAAGAEAAYRLIMSSTRPFRAPLPPSSSSSSSTTTSPPPSPIPPLVVEPDAPRTTPSPDDPLSPISAASPESDLDFDTQSEAYYKPSLSHKFPADIAKAREAYYAKDLPARLGAARALARREPTKEEVANPPATEVELRAERLRKEMAWRGNEEGWAVVRPEAPVAWDERFRGSLSVFTDPPSESEEEEKRREGEKKPQEKK